MHGRWPFILFSLLLLPGAGCSPNRNTGDQADIVFWQKEWDRLDSILHQLPDDFEKTTFLRTYCGGLTDIGVPDDNVIKTYRHLNFDSVQLYHFYPLFLNDSIPAECGITSYFYIKLAQSFGYKAYQYSFGFTDKRYARFIHSFPVIEINYKGAKRLIIQDPYLNLTVRNNAGEPVDFFNFLSNLKQEKYNAVALDSKPVLTTLLIGDTLRYWPYLDDSCRQLMRSMIVQAGGAIAKKIPLQRDFQTLMESPCNNFKQGFEQAMRAHGFTQPFLYAYTLRVNQMAGSADVKIMQARIDSVLRNTVVN